MKTRFMILILLGCCLIAAGYLLGGFAGKPADNSSFNLSGTITNNIDTSGNKVSFVGEVTIPMGISVRLHANEFDLSKCSLLSVYGNLDILGTADNAVLKCTAYSEVIAEDQLFGYAEPCKPNSHEPHIIEHKKVVATQVIASGSGNLRIFDVKTASCALALSANEQGVIYLFNSSLSQCYADMSGVRLENVNAVDCELKAHNNNIVNSSIKGGRLFLVGKVSLVETELVSLPVYSNCDSLEINRCEINAFIRYTKSGKLLSVKNSSIVYNNENPGKGKLGTLSSYYTGIFCKHLHCETSVIIGKELNMGWETATFRDSCLQAESFYVPLGKPQNSSFLVATNLYVLLSHDGSFPPTCGGAWSSIVCHGSHQSSVLKNIYLEDTGKDCFFPHKEVVLDFSVFYNPKDKMASLDGSQEILLQSQEESVRKERFLHLRESMMTAIFQNRDFASAARYLLSMRELLGDM